MEDEFRIYSICYINSRIITLIFLIETQTFGNSRRLCENGTNGNNELKNEPTTQKVFHPPRAFYTTKKRSMSLETQLPDSDATTLKNSAVKSLAERSFNKRNGSRTISCDEKSEYNFIKVKLILLGFTVAVVRILSSSF